VGFHPHRFSRPDDNSTDAATGKDVAGVHCIQLAPPLALNPENDTELALVIEAWPTLPGEIKAAIGAIAKANRPPRPIGPSI
jgi:hypothetical protein